MPDRDRGAGTVLPLERGAVGRSSKLDLTSASGRRLEITMSRAGGGLGAHPSRGLSQASRGGVSSSLEGIGEMLRVGLREGIRHEGSVHGHGSGLQVWPGHRRTALSTAPDATGGGTCLGVEHAHQAAYRTVYDVVITLTRVPYVVAIMAAVVLSYLAYRRRPMPPKWGCAPAFSRCLGFTDSWPRWHPTDGRAARAAGDRLDPVGICLARSRQGRRPWWCQRNLGGRRWSG